MPLTKTVFMFSGQGSQYFHMGRGLYENNQTFRNWMVRLDDLARPSLDDSVIETIYSPQRRKADPFDRTLLTHPAIFMLEYSLAQTLIQAGIVLDAVMGASLGSFAAAAVANFIDVEDALALVVAQALAIEQACPAGGMIAVMAPVELSTEEFFSERCEVASINMASHFVISARNKELVEIEAALQRKKVTYQRLPVSYPFHSKWIDAARAPFASMPRHVRCGKGRLPLVCCQQAAILSELSADFFWNVVRYPIRFLEAAQRFDRQGPCRYLDVGPAGTLATFLKYGFGPNTASTMQAVLTPFGLDQKSLAAAVASC